MIEVGGKPLPFIIKRIAAPVVILEDIDDSIPMHADIDIQWVLPKGGMQVYGTLRKEHYPHLAFFSLYSVVIPKGAKLPMVLAWLSKKMHKI